ncbi:hypothetical protein NLX86_09485 [Streptomyces sp. A3M-1-3]|uniref:hypothetical protein n=1 Tax=Streptomyces sp. A3M-1-3 TaxID=2962044 RepID=UPI0020B648B5|nr:hypothetical protein [Streptomyces sp. A3M-1-3]MCP3818339.1 hypothetical protein [Streptomyces sp. A3M-1-3]
MTEISALHTRLSASATSLGTAHRLIDRLLGESAYWQGEAADAFREAIDGDLPRYLKNAHRSVSKAAKQLRAWHEDLVSYQALARKYDAQAKEHQAAVATAESTHATARTDPDLAAPDASAAETAAGTLDAAAASVTKARAALESVRKLARELEETHRSEASRIAKALNEATDRLAPREPGLLSKATEWLDENLGDVLSAIAATAGLLALLATGPVSVPILLFVAAGASLGAFALHAQDPKIQESLSEAITDRKFDADFWDSTVTLASDLLGFVPGIAAVTHGARGATTAAQAASAIADTSVLGVARAGIHGFSSTSATVMREMKEVQNPLTEWALRSANPAARTAVDYGLPSAGVVTSLGDLTPLSNDEEYEATTTAVDGTRTAVDDLPNNAAKVVHAWTSLNP